MKTIEKVYEIKGVNVHYYEDSVEYGQSDALFHSYYLNSMQFPYDTKHISKAELLNTLNEFISYRDVKDEEFEIYGHCIEASAIVKFNKNSDWDEFSAPTKEDRLLWKQGEMKLYVVHFQFHCEAYKKEKLPI